MDTDTEGGVIWGYCATGSEKSAMVPVRVMTTDTTTAKMGRSMKNRENMAGSTSFPRSLISISFLAGRPGERWRCDGSRLDQLFLLDLQQPGQDHLRFLRQFALVLVERKNAQAIF